MLINVEFVNGENAESSTTCWTACDCLPQNAPALLGCLSYTLEGRPVITNDILQRVLSNFYRASERAILVWHFRLSVCPSHAGLSKNG